MTYCETVSFHGAHGFHSPGGGWGGHRHIIELQLLLYEGQKKSPNRVGRERGGEKKHCLLVLRDVHKSYGKKEIAFFFLVGGCVALKNGKKALWKT